MFALALPPPVLDPSILEPPPAPIAPVAKGTVDAVVRKKQKMGDRCDDKKLRCKDCGEVFIFSAEKQRELAQKGFNTPKTRCDPCAKYKKNRFSAKLR